MKFRLSNFQKFPVPREKQGIHLRLSAQSQPLTPARGGIRFAPEDRSGPMILDCHTGKGRYPFVGLLEG
ncbi:MAG TPA: hypothetical protein VMF86_08150 [Stellaceae bacterium]|nr:hypothetical protein [Stellaceae bacterium]